MIGVLLAPKRQYQGIRLTEAQHQQIKSYEGLTLRAIVAEAYADLVKSREAWTPSGPFDRFPWLGMPLPKKNQKRITVATLPEQVAPLEAWAKRDSMSGADAYYTAVAFWLDRRRENPVLGFLKCPNPDDL